jgi:predicted acylesterase/phospholipase RssA
MYNFSAASGAFPVLYAPVTVPGVGPCVDGGLTNNSPIGAAIDQGAARVILIAPSPARVPSRGAAAGIALVSQLAEILVGERLFRDLEQAQEVNEVLRGLAGLTRDGTLSVAQAQQIRDLLGWHTEIEVISIRPPDELKGSAFSGLWRRRLRAQYIEAGRAAAISALQKHPVY